ncbi:TPA: ECF transporter S component [Candidatus Bathyarchaeota archaeon]|nr:ECF transporter S component [Candidatus Bathyarchaeota archaeon]
MRSLTVYVSLSVIFASLVAATTLAIRIPVVATGGYINVGDAMIFISALLFGPVIGGVAGGVGSAVADMIGYPIYAPFTLIIKGLEGFLAGYIRDARSFKRDLLAWGTGALTMVLGYFVSESYIMGLGIAAASVEVPGNLFQALFGGLIGIPVARTLRKKLGIFPLLTPLLRKETA